MDKYGGFVQNACKHVMWCLDGALVIVLYTVENADVATALPWNFFIWIVD